MKVKKVLLYILLMFIGKAALSQQVNYFVALTKFKREKVKTSERSSLDF